MLPLLERLEVDPGECCCCCCGVAEGEAATTVVEDGPEQGPEDGRCCPSALERASLVRMLSGMANQMANQED